MRLLLGRTTTTTLAILLAVPSATSFTALPISAKRARILTGGLQAKAASTGPSNLLTEGDTAIIISDLLKQEEDILRNFEEESTVLDIIQDVEGNPLSPQYLAKKMGIHTNDAQSYRCPEQGGFRGLMSNGCRVQLLPGGQTAFYKRIAFNELGHCQEKLKTAPHKLKRDMKSYKVVADFLASQARSDLQDKTGVIIPKCYDAEIRRNFANPMKSKFSFLLEDLTPWDGWHQRWLLDDLEECKAALSAYAKIHAFFWNGSTFYDNKDAAQELEAAVWKSGSYVQPEAQNWNQCKIVAEEWSKKRLRFKKELSCFDYWDNLGERLESVAEECGHLAHPFADDTLSEQYKKYRTFTHGDPKQANMFFRHGTTDSSGSEDTQVGLIDFQWSGFGLASTDIAHFLTSAVHADRLVDGGEDFLMRYYFDELQTHLVKFGAVETAEDALKHFSYETFMDQYDTAVLDICRLMIAYTWSRFDEPVEKDDAPACARTMNKTSYNKSIPNIVWLLGRCDEIMKSRGV
mmetsp:Transcript_1488/g.2310  ORF Transcript_1488/g.2310 Transcript_1488/m.2310 type:complete len:518 (+) Transcript_1488:183-1736(+)